MLKIIGSILSVVFVGTLVMFFLGFAVMATYYLTYDFWWKLRWRLGRRKSEHIKAVSIPLINVNENSLKRSTDLLNRRVRMRMAGEAEMHMLKTITMSTDKNGTCYITAWYREKRVEYTGGNYSKSYNNPLSNWQF